MRSGLPPAKEMDHVGSAPLADMIGVSKSYGGVGAVGKVDFTVRPGEVHALLGENGAGKSTLMKIFSGEVGGHRRSRSRGRWTPSVPGWR
jgi:ribose transport system ATP-binding protein